MYECAIFISIDKPIDDSMVTEETKDEQDLSMLVHQQTLPDFFNSITLDLKCNT